MTAALVAVLAKWGVFLFLTIVGVGVAWTRVEKHGAEKAKRKQAERGLDVAKIQIDRLREALPSDAELVRSLERLRDRKR